MHTLGKTFRLIVPVAGALFLVVGASPRLAQASDDDHGYRDHRHRHHHHYHDQAITIVTSKRVIPTVTTITTLGDIITTGRVIVMVTGITTITTLGDIITTSNTRS